VWLSGLHRPAAFLNSLARALALRVGCGGDEFRLVARVTSRFDRISTTPRDTLNETSASPGGGGGGGRRDSRSVFASPESHADSRGTADVSATSGGRDSAQAGGDSDTRRRGASRRHPSDLAPLSLTFSDSPVMPPQHNAVSPRSAFTHANDGVNVSGFRCVGCEWDADRECLAPVTHTWLYSGETPDACATLLPVLRVSLVRAAQSRPRVVSAAAGHGDALRVGVSLSRSPGLLYRNVDVAVMGDSSGGGGAGGGGGGVDAAPWRVGAPRVSVGAACEGRAAQLEQEPASYGAAAVSTSCMDCSYGGRVLCMVEVPVDPRPVGDSWRMASTTVTLAD
jgi:hypothetical protein